MLLGMSRLAYGQRKKFLPRVTVELHRGFVNYEVLERLAVEYAHRGRTVLEVAQGAFAEFGKTIDDIVRGRGPAPRRTPRAEAAHQGNQLVPRKVFVLVHLPGLRTVRGI